MRFRTIFAWFHDAFKEVGNPTYEEQEETIKDIKESLAKLKEKGYTMKVVGRGTIIVTKL